MYTHDPYNGKGRLPGMYRRDKTFQKLLDNLLLTSFTYCEIEISYFEWIIKQMEEYGSYLFFLIGQPERHYKSGSMRSIIRLLYKINSEIIKQKSHNLVKSLYTNKTIADSLRYLKNELTWSLTLLFEKENNFMKEKNELVIDILLDSKATYLDLYKYYIQIANRQKQLNSVETSIYFIKDVSYKRNPKNNEIIFFKKHPCNDGSYVFWNYESNSVKLSRVWSVNIRNPDVIFYKDSRSEIWERTFDNYLFIPKSFYRSIGMFE